MLFKNKIDNNKIFANYAGLVMYLPFLNNLFYFIFFGKVFKKIIKKFLIKKIEQTS